MGCRYYSDIWETDGKIYAQCHDHDVEILPEEAIEEIPKTILVLELHIKDMKHLLEKLKGVPE